jgi:hypothetical protein
MDRVVRYISKVNNLGECVLLDRTNKEVGQLYFRQYYNVLANLIGLNPCSRDLMDYLAEVMDSSNEINNNIRVRKKFLEVIKDRSMQPDGTFQDYSDMNIMKSFKALVERGCLIKLMKGQYRVNPELFFKGSDKARMESIKITLEFVEGARDPSMKVVTKMKGDK